MPETPRFVPHDPVRLQPEEALARGRAFRASMESRRSVRDFRADPLPPGAVAEAIATACSAPSGAHRQPWRFVVVEDPALKRAIRQGAEHEERIAYEGGRMPREWLEALAPLGTDWRKPFLEVAPTLVVVFEEVHGIDAEGRPRKNYYTRESVGIACGLFIAALHQMGICTLTHTPSPMGFLQRLLDRPKHEKPYLLFPVGYPAVGAMVPDLRRKSVDDVTIWKPRSTQAPT